MPASARADRQGRVPAQAHDAGRSRTRIADACGLGELRALLTCLGGAAGGVSGQGVRTKLDQGGRSRHTRTACQQPGAVSAQSDVLNPISQNPKFKDVDDGYSHVGHFTILNATEVAANPQCVP
eukprot:1641507-Rhodomonas_salina.2